MLYDLVMLALMVVLFCLGVLCGLLLLMLYMAIAAPDLLDELQAVAKRKKGAKDARLQ